MKTKSIVILLLLITTACYAQQTIQKKEYFDAEKKQLKKIWYETMDGKYHGKCTEYFKTGIVAKKSTYFQDDVIQLTEYFENGQLHYEMNKNKSFVFDGVQKQYKLVEGKSVLERYAFIKNGKPIEYYWYNTSTTYYQFLKNNVYQEFDQNGKLIFEINNGIINGTREKVRVINNYISYYRDVITEFKLSDDKKNFDYKLYFVNKSDSLILVQHGYFRLKNDSSAFVKLMYFIYEDYIQEPSLKTIFNVSLSSDYFKMLNFYAVKDSVWLVYDADGDKIHYNEFDNGMMMRSTKYYKNGNINSDLIYKDAILFHYVNYDETGKIIESTELDLEKEKLKKLEEEKKEMELKKIQVIDDSIKLKYNRFLNSFMLKEKSDNDVTDKISYPKGEYIFSKVDLLYNDLHKSYNKEKNYDKKIVFADKIIRLLDKINSLPDDDCHKMNRKLKKENNADQIMKLLDI